MISVLKYVMNPSMYFHLPGSRIKLKLPNTLIYVGLYLLERLQIYLQMKFLFCLLSSPLRGFQINQFSFYWSL